MPHKVKMHFLRLQTPCDHTFWAGNPMISVSIQHDLTVSLAKHWRIHMWFLLCWCICSYHGTNNLVTSFLIRLNRNRYSTTLRFDRMILRIIVPLQISGIFVCSLSCALKNTLPCLIICLPKSWSNFLVQTDGHCRLINKFKFVCVISSSALKSKLNVVH